MEFSSFFRWIQSKRRVVTGNWRYLPHAGTLRTWRRPRPNGLQWHLRDFLRPRHWGCPSQRRKRNVLCVEFLWSVRQLSTFGLAVWRHDGQRSLDGHYAPRYQSTGFGRAHEMFLWRNGRCTDGRRIARGSRSHEGRLWKYYHGSATPNGHSLLWPFTGLWKV